MPRQQARCAGTYTYTRNLISCWDKTKNQKPQTYPYCHRLDYKLYLPSVDLDSKFTGVHGEECQNRKIQRPRLAEQKACGTGTTAEA